jgi:hypothetical protein
MTIPEIDHLTERFYQSISFNAEHYPNFDMLQELFYGDGKLINNNFDKPVDFTVQSFSQALMKQIESGNISQFAQQEISDQTELFCKSAQRISVYEHSSASDPAKPWIRGVNYIQYIYIEGRWLITSMIWCDETDQTRIPEAYLL